MMELNELDGFGDLYDVNYIATPEEVRETLKNAFEQASQGWGVRRDVGVYLALVRELRLSLALAGTSDTYLRKLKGLQLELGRVRKALEGSKKRADSLQNDLADSKLETVEATAEAIEAIDGLNDDKVALRQQIESLTEPR